MSNLRKFDQISLKTLALVDFSKYLATLVSQASLLSAAYQLGLVCRR